MRYISAVFILQFSFFTSPAWAVRPYTPVHPDPVLESWRWRSFQELNGMGLRCMAEAKDRTMWFGVDDGVRRYDGIHWTVYTEKDGLYGAPVYALCAARDGSLYAGTGIGITRFREGRWRRVFPPQGDLTWHIDDLMEARDGSLWAGTSWGALRLSQGDTTLYTTEQMGAALRAMAPYVRLSIVPDAAVPAQPYGEGIGVRVAEGGHLDLGTSRHIPLAVWSVARGGPGEAAGLKVGDCIVAVDGQPRVAQRHIDGHVGTPVKMTVRRFGRSGPFEVTVTRRKVEETCRGFPIYDVYEDREGTIWFGLGGHDGGGIVHYAPSTSPGTPRSPIRNPQSEWRLYTEKNGLAISYGPRITQTRDGVIWIVYLGGLGSVNQFDGRKWTHFRLGELGGLNINPSVLETRDGTLWVGGHWGYLYAFRRRKGNTTGEERVRREDWKVYRPSEVPVPADRLILLEASDGALWVGGLGQEAARLDYGTDRWTSYEGLLSQSQTPDGAEWFLSQDSSIVRCGPSTLRQGQGSGESGKAWTRYGVEDGLMNWPYRLLTTKDGTVWAAGMHDSTAATAWFDGRRWSIQMHPRLSPGVNRNGVFDASDGSLWFGAAPFPLNRGYLGGVLRFSGNTWTHYRPPEAPDAPSGIGQTPDGMLWFGGNHLRRFDGRTWAAVTDPEGLASWIHAILGTAEGDLFVGTRQYGIFRFDGNTWRQYCVQDGLADSRVDGISQTSDGSIWAITPKGFSRFDGRTWTTHALPADLGWGLRQSRDGALWINGSSREGTSFRWRTIRYQPDPITPATEITLSLDEVSQPGNTTIAWTGAAPWKATPEEEVQYSYRMDSGEWSPFSHGKNRVFLALDSGAHAFEVRARDRDFNVDPTPAAIRFKVVPPVYRQPWFLSLMAVLLGGIGFQTTRVVRRDRRLKDANTALSSANKELFGVNRELQQKTEDLEQANAQVQEVTERKSQFLASMSHELRTPMNAIIGFTNLVLRRSGEALPENQRENLVKVRQASGHLLNLINDLLDLSRIEAGRMEVKPVRFGVKGLIASCCATVNPLVKPGVELSYEVGEDVEEAHTDEGKVRQIVINLLSNALKFTERGEVRVRCQVSRATQNQTLDTWHVERGTGAEDGILAVSVSDTGVGIPPDALGLIFEEFRQVEGSHQQQKGTGLGLAITKRLTELLGGTIGVESEVGRGSTFTVRVPMVYRAH